jgi:hypothetical protein
MMQPMALIADNTLHNAHGLHFLSVGFMQRLK